MAQIETAIECIRDLIGERISTADAVRAQHGRDEFWHHAALPDAVAFAEKSPLPPLEELGRHVFKQKVEV